MSSPKAVYVHIPFCEQICHYCDFNKVFLKGQPVNEYISASVIEMQTMVSQFPFEEISTIYVGGGTPTALSASQLDKLLGSINDHFPLQKNGEFTIEVNPGNVSNEKLAVIKAAGVNRLSIGVQAFQGDLLKAIGRNHQEKDIYETISLARKFGFENISIDLMFGLPDQTVAMFEESLNKAIELDVSHFSAYSLKVEQKTRFYQLHRKGNLPLPTEDDEVAMFELLIDRLTDQGYNHYEISNFGKRGYESKHNLTYWNNQNYFGIGAGAHGYVNGHRYANAGPIKKYMSLIESAGRSVIDDHLVTEDEKIEEEMFLGLRKLEGISTNDFTVKFGKSPFDLFEKEITTLINQELLQILNGKISLTRRGIFVANDVFEKFLFY